MLHGPDSPGKGTSKDNAAFPQGHLESLARGPTYLKSLRNILKLSRLGIRPSICAELSPLYLVSRFELLKV